MCMSTPKSIQVFEPLYTRADNRNTVGQSVSEPPPNVLYSFLFGAEYNTIKTKSYTVLSY